MIYNNIEKLREILVEELRTIRSGKPILLPFDKDLLHNLIFEANIFAETLAPVLHLIDFSDINFQGYRIQDYAGNFIGLHGVKIKPQTVFEKRFNICYFRRCRIYRLI